MFWSGGSFKSELMVKFKLYAILKQISKIMIPTGNEQRATKALLLLAALRQSCTGSDRQSLKQDLPSQCQTLSVSPSLNSSVHRSTATEWGHLASLRPLHTWKGFQVLRNDSVDCIWSGHGSRNLQEGKAVQWAPLWFRVRQGKHVMLNIPGCGSSNKAAKT